MGAKWLGTFFGTLLGSTLQAMGPEFVAGVIREAMASKDEVAKKNDAVQSALAVVNDPAGLLGQNASNPSGAGNGSKADDSH